MKASSNASPDTALRMRGGRPVACALLSAAVLSGCGGMPRSAPTSALPAALVAQARPIGRGISFHPPGSGPVVGRCRRGLGRRFGVHIELFAANRVVLIAAGIGTRPPRSYSLGRISNARCYGDLVTLEPTGVGLVRWGTQRLLSDLFRSWGQPLSSRRLGPFAAAHGTRVSVFIGGRRWSGSPRDVPLARHSEIVLEVGPYVPPHAFYTLPPGS
jgi:hypothetical protein